MKKSQTTYYEPYPVQGHAAWYILSNEEDIAEQGQIAQVKQDAMLRAGTYPTKEYLDSLDKEQRLKVYGNAFSIVQEFTENTFFRPIGDWLRAHPEHPTYYVDSEEHGYRVCIDFKTEAGQKEFLAAHPKWTIEKPRVWWDRDHGIKIPTMKENYGRNEDYDLFKGERIDE